MKQLIWIIGVLVLVACKSNENSPQEVTLDDITSGAKTDYDRTKEAEGKIVIPHFYDSLSRFSQHFIDSLEWTKTAVFTLDTVIFPDRFGAKDTEKWCYLQKNTNVVVMHWEFETTLQAENALFNWLDCWGQNCQSFTIGSPGQLSKRYFLLLQGEKQLYAIESKTAMDGKRWAELLQNEHKMVEWKYAFLQTPKKTINWEFLKELPVKQ